MIGLITVVLLAAPSADPAVDKIFATHCHRCHGRDGANEGGFNFVLDRDRLVASRKVVPGDPAKSKLLARMTSADDPMPPEEEKVRPSAAEIDAVRKWIADGAPAFRPAARERPFVSPQSMIVSMNKDVAAADPRDRPYLRYFTLTHLYNAGVPHDELESYRRGLAKLVNSLSWGRQVVVPKPIDPGKTLLRIDLRDYKWTDRIWDEILFHNAFGVEYGTEAEKQLQAATRTRLAYVRADWFVSAASRPPLYHEILELPTTDRALEAALKVNVEENIATDRIARAGFNGSGVSRNNRLIERHESPYGAYWKSYDFAGNAQEKNLFARPFGPGTRRNDFRHDGGEIIFNLPNGLQAYLLVDADGRRIDKGPVEIVSDPKQPDRQVVNGLSCMSCHARGMIEKDDQIRSHVEKNPAGFSPGERSKVNAVYPPRDAFRALLKADAERFRAAVAATGAPLSRTEPVAALARKFDEELDLPMIAAELGVRTDTFLKRLDAEPKLARILGPARSTGGTVQRDLVSDQAMPSVGRFSGGVFVTPSRPQAPGLIPDALPPEHVAQDTGALTIRFPDASPAKGKQVVLRRFLDAPRKQWIYVSQRNDFAIVPQTRPGGPSRDLNNLVFFKADLPAYNELPAATVTVLALHDTFTDAVIYVSDRGGVAAVRAAKPAAQIQPIQTLDPMVLEARGVGEAYATRATKVFRLAVIEDPNLKQFVYVSGEAALAASPHRPEARRHRLPHGYALAARAPDETTFGQSPRQFPIDVIELPGSKTLLWRTRTAGRIAVTEGAAAAAPTVPPTLVQRIRIRRQLEPTNPSTDADKQAAIDVYRDPNTASLIYMSHTGDFAVTK